MKKEYFWIIQVMTTLPEEDDKYISYKYNEDFHNPILTTFKKEAKKYPSLTSAKKVKMNLMNYFFLSSLSVLRIKKIRKILSDIPRIPKKKISRFELMEI